MRSAGKKNTLILLNTGILTRHPELEEQTQNLGHIVQKALQ